MPVDLEQLVREVLGRTPDWLRRDLCSDDVKTRERAEETLAAMIAAAVGGA